MAVLMDCVQARENISCDDDDIAALINEITDSYVDGCLRATGAALDESPWLQKDRRGRPRTVISIPFYLWPVNGKLPASDTMETPPEQLAITRDLSYRGVSLQSDRQLEHRFYVAEFDCVAEYNVRLLLEVCWRQQRSPHFYVAGCRILGPLPD